MIIQTKHKKENLPECVKENWKWYGIASDEKLGDVWFWTNTKSHFDKLKSGKYSYLKLKKVMG